MRDLKRIFAHIGPYRRELAAAMALVFIETGFELFIPLLMADIIDVGVKHQDVHYILAKGVKIENIVFVGCGASMAESYPGRYFLESCAKKLRIFHYTASEFNWNTPAWLGDTSVVISVSMGGNTPETVQANSVAKAPPPANAAF